MPKRRSKRATAQCRGIRDAFRRAAARGIFTKDDARALMAAKIGFSAADHGLPLAPRSLRDFDDGNPRHGGTLFTHPEPSMIQVSNAHVRASDTYLRMRAVLRSPNADVLTAPLTQGTLRS